MTTFKDMEDRLKKFLLEEQSDAHNIKTMSAAKYNNIKIWMNPVKTPIPHVIIRISISEATYALSDFSKTNGGLGFEERYVIKWFGRAGIKEKLNELWALTDTNKEDQ
ncbi:MAG: hypothetical protein NC408_02505 [Candidatus Gastranaerophilales bacterium]|nr:hypothetical protein [Candidatus Gastranaerophilales bacterium]MCM1073535.1 hypothetical protein [Bacteroides sp.]